MWVPVTIGIVVGMWEALADRYLKWLELEGRRPHTIRGYRGDLAGLVRSLSAGPAGPAAVGDWAASLESLAPATRARRLSAGRGFLRWSASQGVEVEGVELMEHRDERDRPHPVVAPDPATVEAVLASIPRQADRDQLLFRLIASAGLRPGEALAVQVEDFDASFNHLRVQGWGGSSREVLVDDPELQLRLTHWIRALGRTSGPLFCASGRSTPLRYQSVQGRWKRYTARAGVELRLGELRLHHAAELLGGGVPEWAVRERLGQATGPLPTPQATSADDEIRSWRQRHVATQPTPPAKPSRSRRSAA